MNICPECGNQDVQKFYILGIENSHSERYCDICINDRRKDKTFAQKIKGKIFGEETDA